MPLALYVKTAPKPAGIPNPKKERFFYSLITFVGFISIIFAVYPFVAWRLTTLPKLTTTIDEIPVPKSQVLSAKTILSANVQVVKDPDGFSFFTTNYKPPEPRPEEFSLTIPKLKVEKARVLVDDLNFYDNLSHFPGSALPGEIGNSFITGHSVLPQFYDPQNYRSIFTKLSDLEVGDDVYAQLDDKTYHYVVQYSKVVDPQDVSVLAPISQNGRNLTLMSCVPPGTNIKRLVVVTSII